MHAFKSLVFLLCLISSHFALAGTSETELVSLSDEVLRDIMTIPERSIPPKLLSEAQAIAIIPEVIKVGLVVGGRYGRGIIVIKDPTTQAWSDPVFLKLKGGSVGLQLGAQSSDLILVFKNKRGLKSLMSGKFTLGADAAIAAGPVGRNAAAATDVKLQAEILSYSRSRGLFAGLSLDGTSLDIDHRSNALFYERERVSSAEIFNGFVRSPRTTQALKNSLRQYAKQ